MNIQWFDTIEKDGIASLYNTCITLNTVASVNFEMAYRVQIGIDDKKNVVLKPLTKERVLRGDLDESALQKISITKSYSRVASTAIMKKISEVTGIQLTATPTKFPTAWNQDEGILVIKTGGK